MFPDSFGKESRAQKCEGGKLSRAEKEERNNASLPEFNGPPDGRGAIKSCGRN